MEISERIKKLDKYFSEMQIVTADNNKKVIYVLVNFPRGWEISDELAKKKDVSVAEGETPGQYFFCADIDTGVDAIFDCIDENVDKMKEALERAQLLAAKTKELRDMFENESIPIEKLRALKISISEEEEIIIHKPKDTTK